MMVIVLMDDGDAGSDDGYGDGVNDNDDDGGGEELTGVLIACASLVT
jgi:hypothetical protein